jgi:myosin heavy subunit
MSELQQPIDPQYVASIEQAAASVKAVHEFASEIPTKRQEIQTAINDVQSQKRTWDELFANFSAKKQELDKVLAEIHQAQSTYANARPNADAQIAHIQTVASQSDEVKKRIDADEVHIGKQKAKIDSDTETVEQTKERFDDLKSQADKLHAELSSQQANLQSQITDIQSKLAILNNLEQELLGLKSSAQTSQSEAEAANQNIQEQHQTFQTSIEQTNQKLTELNEKQGSLENAINNIEAKNTEISGLHKTLFVESRGPDNRHIPSIKVQIDNFKELCKATHEEAKEGVSRQDMELKNFSAEQKIKFDELYNALNDKINSLLPGAGAAGLASSYYEAKMRYSTTNDLSSLDDDVSKRMKLKWQDFVNQFAEYSLNMILFIAPLVALIVLFPDFHAPDAFKDNPYAILFYKVTLTIPFFIISSYGVLNILKTKQLFEEYNHKQRVMQLYHGFKKEIDMLGNADLKKKLLDVMLDVVKEKPSGRSNRGYRFFFFGKPLDKFLDKLSTDKE